jgi:hypothetical protein
VIADKSKTPWVAVRRSPSRAAVHPAVVMRFGAATTKRPSIIKRPKIAPYVDLYFIMHGDWGGIKCGGFFYSAWPFS